MKPRNFPARKLQRKLRAKARLVSTKPGYGGNHATTSGVGAELHHPQEMAAARAIRTKRFRGTGIQR